MNLRISLVLVIVLSISGIALTWAVKNLPEASRAPALPFTYTIAPDDLRQINIKTRSGEMTFFLKPEERVWYFKDPADIPVNHDRFGGMTFLVGGPKAARRLQDQIENESVYGLDNPTMAMTLTLRDGSVVVVELGEKTPNLGSHYARIVGSPKLWLIDSSWGDVLTRLTDDPPFPNWRYSLNPANVKELIFLEGNEIVRGIAYHDDKGWVECDIIEGQPPPVPCEGETPINESEFLPYLDHLANPQFQRVVKVAREVSEDDDELYGVSVNAPYIDIRVEEQTRARVTEVSHVTITLGELTPDGQGMYVRAMEEPDVAEVDADWGRKVKDLFSDRSFLEDG